MKQTTFTVPNHVNFFIDTSILTELSAGALLNAFSWTISVLNIFWTMIQCVLLIGMLHEILARLCRLVHKLIQKTFIVYKMLEVPLAGAQVAQVCYCK